ncbi:hypothetical protein TIFTF001_055475 [Ficus carica]|jgi:hypothetical protein
MGNT